MRTRPTKTTQVTGNWGTSSGFNPEEDFKDPQDITDVVGVETQIPRGGRSPVSTPSVPSAPSRGINLEKTSQSPFGGLDAKPKGRSPIGLEAGKSAGGGLNVTASIPVGGPISARGGVNIKDGAIKGAQVGVGIGAGPIGASVDVGTDADESGRGGCFQYVTVTAGPFSHTYGQNVCESKGARESPSPSPWTPWRPTSNGGYETERPRGQTLKPGENPSPLPPPPWQEGEVCGYLLYGVYEFINIENGQSGGTQTISMASLFRYSDSPNIPRYWEAEQPRFYRNSHLLPNTFILQPGPDSFGRAWAITWGKINFSDERVRTGWGTQQARGYSQSFENSSIIMQAVFYRYYYAFISLCPGKTITSPSPSSFPPLTLNSSPRKKMNDDCCKILALYHQEQLRLMGRHLGPNGELIPIPPKVFFNEEHERLETPIDPKNPNKKIKLKFNNFYELLKYCLKQQIALDEALDPRSFDRPSGKLQNPEYIRDAEQSLKSNTQPDKDKAGNKRELEIGKDIVMLSALQQQQYIFEALRRLEYLFPYGELSDAQIERELLIPSKKEDKAKNKGKTIQIHNMIHAYEIQMQYLNAILGDPRDSVFLKDVDPNEAGNQEFSFNAMSLSHLVRELFKFQLDTAGDVDMARESAIRDLRTNLANRIQIVQIAEMVQALFEDSGMMEYQDWIELPLEGDPYAGHWKKGQGFEPSPKLDSNKEEDIEELGRATNKNFVAQIKVLRRDKREKTDMRDLIRGLADFMQRLASNPAAELGQILENARFKVKTEMALVRANVAKAATVARNRTRKKKK